MKNGCITITTASLVTTASFAIAGLIIVGLILAVCIWLTIEIGERLKTKVENEYEIDYPFKD